jgi:hypothetical protein|tara:strand:- start:3171 stop:4067 length:897 start_codon:yes stop_codon:yes gene_type:complete
MSADDRWPQMRKHGKTRQIDKTELSIATKETIRKTIEHSSTAPYLHRTQSGIELIQDDDYNLCKWTPADIWLKDGFSSRQKKQLKYYGWWDLDTNELADIWYKTNRQGFRDDHFSNRQGIACFGCSHTYGSGVHNHQSWPSQLAELTGEKTFNLGTPAGSLALGIWYALHCLDEDLPNLTAIAVLVPPMGRAPVAMKHDDFYFVSNMRVELLEIISPELELDITTIDKYVDMITATSHMTYDMQLKTLELIAKARGIPLVVTQLSEITPSDWARDMVHHGPRTHLDVAKVTMQKLGKY